MSVSAISRNNYCVIIRNTNAVGQAIEHDYLDIRPCLTQTVHADNGEYAPAQSDNWSRIAWKKLGNGRHYWIIADYSGVVDPLSELQPETKTRFLAQLTAPAHPGDTKITLTSVRKVMRGRTLQIEDLNPANALQTTANVLGVDTINNIVTLSAPLSLPPGSTISAALSRVAERYQTDVRLIVPSPHRALFEALDFNNPLNTAVL